MAKSVTCLWVMALALLPFLTGCGSTPVTIRYTPVAAVQTLADDSAPAPRLFVMKFADAHDAPGYIGANRNLYGMKLNDVRTSDDVGMIVGEAMTDALRKAGLKADFHPDRRHGDKVPAEQTAKYDFVVSGEITQINVDTKPGWNTVDANAQVTVRILVRHNGKEEWVGPVDGNASQSDMAGGLAQIMSQALDSAIGNCMRAAIQHLNATGTFKSRT